MFLFTSYRRFVRCEPLLQVTLVILSSPLGADQSYADLKGVVLTDADLTGACLLGTDFRGADLGNVSFGKSMTKGAKFARALRYFY